MQELVIITISLICIGAFYNILAGKSNNFVDGVKQLITDIIDSVGAANSPQQPPITIEHPFTRFTDLTAEFKPFFSRLNFDKAYSNQEQLQVSYTFSDCQADILIIEAVFEAFIREACNVNQADKVFVFAQKQGMHLILTYAISDKCKRWVIQQEANRKSRQISQDEDLVE
ncbi:MAG: hypothetical protein K2K46_13280 [Lachnospiraceae bacterium]|nr:hypothetical protein [Lachnospiraceae bacterium]